MSPKNLVFSLAGCVDAVRWFTNVRSVLRNLTRRWWWWGDIMMEIGRHWVFSQIGGISPRSANIHDIHNLKHSWVKNSPLFFKNIYFLEDDIISTEGTHYYPKYEI